MRTPFLWVLFALTPVFLYAQSTAKSKEPTKTATSTTTTAKTVTAPTPATPPGKPKNLVVNPSFEQRADTTKALELKNTIDRAFGWDAPNAGASLLYTSTKKQDKWVIYDPFGSSWDFSARTGRNVGGVTVKGGTVKHPKREYIQGTLREPLTVGKKYYFAFWVHYHCEGANNIGIAFVPDRVKLDSAGLLPFKPVSYQAKVTNYDKFNTWALVRDSFVAYKPFQHFVIGNFFPDSLTKVQAEVYNHYFAYIDDILVMEAENQTANAKQDAKKEEAKWVENTVVSQKANSPIELKNVFFEYDSAILIPESTASLDELYEQMKVVGTLRIRIKGHTSTEGSAEYNKKLSDSRAKSVRNYLIKKGIAADRIESGGYGETLPVADNDTEENRAKNRRVEFEIISK